MSCGSACPHIPAPALQELAERESALASKESKLAQMHADLAERAAGLESAKARLEADRRALEQREESLAAAQAEVGMQSCLWWPILRWTFPIAGPGAAMPNLHTRQSKRLLLPKYCIALH